MQAHTIPIALLHTHALPYFHANANNGLRSSHRPPHTNARRAPPLRGRKGFSLFHTMHPSFPRIPSGRAQQAD